MTLCACVFWCEIAIHKFKKPIDFLEMSSFWIGKNTYFGNFYLSCWSACFSQFRPTQSCSTHTHTIEPSHMSIICIKFLCVCDFWCVVKYSTNKSLCNNMNSHGFYYFRLVSHCLLCDAFRIAFAMKWFCVCVCVLKVNSRMIWRESPHVLQFLTKRGRMRCSEHYIRRTRQSSFMYKINTHPSNYKCVR